jgi:VWFA-related protein
MTRGLITTLAVACAVAFPGAQQTPSTGHATFRGGTDTVSVFTTVIDRSGRLIPDLTRDDFQIFDNGRPQPLTVFKNEIQPITIVVMLDRSSSMLDNYAVVQSAAERFVAALLPADKARLGSFSRQVQIDPDEFTSDREGLVNILRTRLLPPGDTPLWNATFEAMNALSKQEGRRVVLLFSDGYDSPARPAGNVRFDEVLTRAQTDEIMVYAIGLGRHCDGESNASPAVGEVRAQRGPGGRGRGGFPQPRPPFPFPIPGSGPGGPRVPPVGPGIPPPEGRDGGVTVGGREAHQPLCLGIRPDPSLKQLADEGGGGFFELRRKDDLSATFARVADELHHQYLLGFKAPALDGSLHKLEVRLRNPTWTARARRNYLAADGTKLATK